MLIPYSKQGKQQRIVKLTDNHAKGICLNCIVQSPIQTFVICANLINLIGSYCDIYLDRNVIKRSVDLTC